MDKAQGPTADFFTQNVLLTLLPRGTISAAALRLAMRRLTRVAQARSHSAQISDVNYTASEHASDVSSDIDVGDCAAAAAGVNCTQSTLDADAQPVMSRAERRGRRGGRAASACS